MKNLFKILAYIQLGVGTFQMVNAVEQQLEGKGLGPAKLGVVVNTVGAAASAVPEIAQAVSENDAKSFAEKLAPMLVSTLNASGIFKKS